jgi:hypothetical protein
MNAALRHIDLAGAPPATRALLHRLLAYVRLYERDFPSARSLAEDAAATFESLGARQDEAASLVVLGMVHIYAGDPEPAVDPLIRGREIAGKCDDEELYRAASHALVRCFLDLGRPRHAKTVAQQVEAMFLFSSDKLALLRFQWQRGLIDRDLGDLDLAYQRLEMVREGFARRNLCYEVAVVSLDLASVHLLDHWPIGALKILGEAVPLFHSLGVTRDLLAALAQVRASIREPQAALALLRTLTRQLTLGHPRDGG